MIRAVTDAMSMIVDTLTYVGNLIAECCGRAKGNVECKVCAENGTNMWNAPLTILVLI